MGQGDAQVSEALKAETQSKAVHLRTALKDVITRLTGAEKDLWSLRLQEVRIWQSVHPKSNDARVGTIHEQVLMVLDQREAAVNRAISQIASIDETYAKLKDDSAKAEARVGAARARFAKAEEAVEQRTITDPAVVAHDQEEARLQRISKRNENWSRDLDELVSARVAEFKADPVFAYLDAKGYGTDSYSAGRLVRWLDGIVARWTSYGEERANLQAIRAYPDEYGETMRKLRSSIERLPAQRQLLVRRIRDGLDAEREILADTLNASAAIVEKFEAAKRAKAAAVDRVSSCINGNDEETQLVVKAVVALLASERASATLRGDEKIVRAAGAEVDELLKRRIAFSREADELRRKASEMLSLVTDIQKLLDADAEREVGAERFEFAMVRAGIALGE